MDIATTRKIIASTVLADYATPDAWLDVLYKTSTSYPMEAMKLARAINAAPLFRRVLVAAAVRIIAPNIDSYILTIYDYRLEDYAQPIPRDLAGRLNAPLQGMLMAGELNGAGIQKVAWAILSIRQEVDDGDKVAMHCLAAIMWAPQAELILAELEMMRGERLPTAMWNIARAAALRG